mmetsp:Transcript_42661/g.140136  ORF Transcript_42661/g.140136 Transcript_42661/m.140136 type:complete len:707 (-) Transcript_42661:8-2128(-)
MLAVLVHGGSRRVLLLLRDLGGDHRHLDPPRAVGEGSVVGDFVGRRDLLAGRILGQDLVLADAEREHVALELLRGQVEVALDVGEGHRVRLVEEQQDAGLVGGDEQVVLLALPRGRELAHHGRRAQRVHPPQPAVRGAQVVKGLEGLDALQHLLWQVELVRLVRRPEAGGEHLHRQVGVELELLVLDVLGEGGLDVLRQVHVGHHALQLRGELRAAPQLELGDHRALRVVARRARQQQPLRELLLVELGEDVLVGQVAKEPHHLLQLVLERLVREPLARLFEQVVAKVGEQLCGGALADVLVDEDLEGLLHRLVEDVVPLEAPLLGPRPHQLGVLVVDVEQLLHVRHQVALGVDRLLLDEREADVGDVLAHDVCDRRQPGGDAREEAEHPRQVLRLVVEQQLLAAGVLLLEQLLLRVLQQLLLAHLEQLLLGRGVQVVGHAVLLLLEPVLGLAHVLRKGVVPRPLCRLARVVVRGRREEHLLKVGRVRLERGARAAHLDEDVDDRLDELLVHLLALALAPHQLQDRRPHLSLHRVEDDLEELLRPYLCQLRQRQPLHVEAVQVLEDVREEADDRLVVLPAPHQLPQHRLVMLLLDARQDARSQVVDDSLAIVVVQRLAPVVWRLLRAHGVDRRVQLRVLVGAYPVLVHAARRILENLLDLEHAARFQLVPAILELYDLSIHDVQRLAGGARSSLAPWSLPLPLPRS